MEKMQKIELQIYFIRDFPRLHKKIYLKNGQRN